jgi:Protein of unknown function (DUF3892)
VPRVDCVNKTDRYNPHERISNVGGPNPNGSRWRLTQPDAIDGIESGRWSFWVERPPAQHVEVVVAISQYGHKYLKTTADGEQPDNLLALPECV